MQCTFVDRRYNPARICEARCKEGYNLCRTHAKYIKAGKHRDATDRDRLNYLFRTGATVVGTERSGYRVVLPGDDCVTEPRKTQRDAVDEALRQERKI